MHEVPLHAKHGTLKSVIQVQKYLAGFHQIENENFLKPVWGDFSTFRFLAKSARGELVHYMRYHVHHAGNIHNQKRSSTPKYLNEFNQIEKKK